ncbi:MAG: hypothetical protein FWF72_03985 [Paludibacter sp.]|nr:hypothetical protein [Paludibacter sp.]
MKNIYKHKIISFLILLFAATASISAQDTVSVALRSNVQKNKIQLRWAATTSNAWNYTNKYGFMLERYTLLRNGQALATPERVILTPSPLKAKPEAEWTEIAQRDDYAAIIAQALFGDKFDTSSGQANVGQIIARSKEQEQRFGFSLYAADLSFEAALYAGWAFEDANVKQGEKYLYRLFPVKASAAAVVDTAMVYVGLEDYEQLPEPVGLAGIFGNGNVLLTWDYEMLNDFYGAYYVERSENKVNFKRITDLPITNIAGGSRIFYTDSIQNGKTYYYRVVGINAFGQTSPPSQVIEGKGTPRLIYVPHITYAMPDDKGGVEVFWEFDPNGDSQISSFELCASQNEKGDFVAVVQNIAPAKRSIVYDKPLPTAYYVIKAIPPTGEPTVSFPHLIQMEDSIPPAVPTGLEGVIDSLGIVRLRWNANTDADLLGYRIYRAQIEGEELIPLNDVALLINEYTDTVNVYSLNANAYYAVAAIDKRYNQSQKCDVVILKKPELIPPTQPVFTNFEATDDGNMFEWATGNEKGIKVIIRRYRYNDQAEVLKTVEDSQDMRKYCDSQIEEGKEYYYELVCENSSKLQSLPSPRIKLKAKIKQQTKNDANKIESFKIARAGNGIKLTCQYNLPNVRSVSIYKKAGDEPQALWLQTVDVSEREWTDGEVRSGVAYEYMLVVKLESGKPITANAKINF